MRCTRTATPPCRAASPDSHDAGTVGGHWTDDVPDTRASGAPRRGIVDPRLSRYARATRPFIAASTAAGFGSALLIIAQAWLLAYVIAGAFAGRGLGSLSTALALLVAVVLARALVAWAAELAAVRSATRAKQQLRFALLRHLAALGPARIGEERTGEIATLATRGIDALD